MIPFGSQRGSGHELAIHLLNEHDNEFMELAELRGAVADDLPGAFAEWEAQSHAMTKAQKYLYSLSVNPDPNQPPLTREQYEDYIVRVEERLGLTGQPRAVVFHIKNEREHLHAVWSRIDVNECKAIHMPFDKDKLMMVTREFARDHGIKLPDGYDQYFAKEQERSRQLSMYDKAKQDRTGLTKQQHMEAVTEAWTQSDTPHAFLNALQDKGYLLATGKRPYVLVDHYGETHALPRLIDDKSVRTKDIRAFLETAINQEDLPSVEEAQAEAKALLADVERHKKHEAKSEEREKLALQQRERRERAEADLAALKAEQALERQGMLREQKTERDQRRSAFLAKQGAIRAEREAKKAKGLAGFLSKVSGVDLVRQRLQRRQDKERMDAYLAERRALRQQQEDAKRLSEHEQRMKAAERERRVRALDQLDQRERKSLDLADLRHSREKQRREQGVEHMPRLKLELTPPGRRAVPHKAKTRFTSAGARERTAERVRGNQKREVESTPSRKPETAREPFDRASRAQASASRTLREAMPASQSSSVTSGGEDKMLASERLRQQFARAASERSASGGDDAGTRAPREPTRGRER